jgi:hypothetical protein
MRDMNHPHLKTAIMQILGDMNNTQRDEHRQIFIFLRILRGDHVAVAGVVIMRRD